MRSRAWSTIAVCDAQSGAHGGTCLVLCVLCAVSPGFGECVRGVGFGLGLGCDCSGKNPP